MTYQVEPHLLTPIDISTLAFLPLPPGDASITLSLIDVNHFECVKKALADTDDLSEKIEVPCLAFLLERTDGSAWLWDMGFRPDPTCDTTPAWEETIKQFKPAGDVRPEVFTRLTKEGFDTGKIKGVLLSHEHFDPPPGGSPAEASSSFTHSGNLDAVPSGLPIFCGSGTLKSIGPAYPTNKWSEWHERWIPKLTELPPTSNDVKWDAKVAETSSCPGHKWEKMGSFENAVDWFGDGSLWLLDAPGHCGGHMMGLVRVTSDPATYVLLGGDCCHHQSNVFPVPTPRTGPDHRKPFSMYVWEEGGAAFTMHTDPVRATQTVARVTRMAAEENVMAILAHEGEYKGVVDEWPASMNEWKVKGWKEAKEKRLRDGLDK